MEFDSKRYGYLCEPFLCRPAFRNSSWHLQFYEEGWESLRMWKQKARVVLDHPLSYLGVGGMKKPPRISKITIDLYFYSFLEEEEAIERCREALKKNILYQTILPAMEIELRYHVSL